jgi:hypothetical protein
MFGVAQRYSRIGEKPRQFGRSAVTGTMHEDGGGFSGRRAPGHSHFFRQKYAIMDAAIASITPQAKA